LNKALFERFETSWKFICCTNEENTLPLMKVSGFTFIKNAVKFQYPIVEAIQSILPLCDEVIVAVGDSGDNTRELVRNIHPQKIKIIDTVWDESLKEGGKVLATETDKALAAVSPDADWCFYIQGDEVVHEDDHNEIRRQMERWKDDKEVDGLLFKYKHFYGSFDYVGVASNWYRHEIRIVKNDKSIYSYRDAQGFRKGANQKLKVKPINAYIYHYGWVREPKMMYSKQTNFGRFYGDAEKSFEGEFDYSNIDALRKFKGSHPAVMQHRIGTINWKFRHELKHNKLSPKERLKNLVERLTGRRPFDYQNYVII
jgi:hypothetical protein